MDLNSGPSIHYSQLQPLQTPGPLVEEWETYLKEIDRLLADGREGQWVLIHGKQVLGLFNSHADALAEGYRRYLFAKEAFLVHRVATLEPVTRVRAA